MTEQNPPDIMAALAAEINARSTTATATNALLAAGYAYYQVPAGTSLLVRLTTHKNSATSTVLLPWRDWFEHRFTLQGMRNSDHDSDEPVTVVFTSDATWGLPDKANAHIKAQGWWDSNRDLAKAGYHQRSTIMPCTIVASPVVEKVTPVSKARYLKAGPQLAKATESALLNGGFDHLPWDWSLGRDLKIPVSMQGGFRHYTAVFLGKERAVPEPDRIPDDQLLDLDAIVGQPPSAEVRQLQFELYMDSLDGKSFDNAKYGKHFRAFTNKKTNGQATPTAAPTAAELQAGTEQLAELRSRTSSIRAAAAE
jgi:hypothetical protein